MGDCIVLMRYRFWATQISKTFVARQIDSLDLLPAFLLQQRALAPRSNTLGHRILLQVWRSGSCSESHAANITLCAPAIVEDEAAPFALFVPVSCCQLLCLLCCRVGVAASAPLDFLVSSLPLEGAGAWRLVGVSGVATF